MRSDNDWIEYLRHEEENFLPEAPEGLWDGIEKHLPSKTSRVVPLWVRYCATAACIALVCGVGLHLAHHSGKMETPYRDIAQEISPAKMEADAETQPIHATILKKTLATVSVKQAEMTESNAASLNTDAEEQQVADTPTSSSQDENRSIDKRETPTHPANHGRWNYIQKKKRAASESISLSVYGGNLMANSTSSQAGYNILCSNGFDTAEGEDNPYEDIDLLNQDLEPDTRKHYRIPLRAGVRVSIPITDRLAVESGVTYTRLSSTVESGSKENYYSTDQTLHYIGIPLKLRYQVWNNKRAGVYVSGGGTVEKCVHGKAKTDFFIGDGKHTYTKQAISEHRPQMSLALSVGLEANITKDISLFAEPGISYYINNHSNVDNVYKDKPFNVDLNIGIRFNINK